jgi:MGT family glycosyltransferase
MDDALDFGASHFWPLASGAEIDLRSPDTDPVRDWEPRTQLGSMLRISRWMYGDQLTIAPEVVHVIERERPDVVLVDAMLLGALAGAERSGRPTAAIMHGPWFVPVRGAAPFGLGITPTGGIRDRLLVAGARLTFLVNRRTLNRMRRTIGLSDLRNPAEQSLVADRTLVLTSAHFDVAPVPLPKGVVYVGAQLGVEDPLPEQLEMPDGDEPLVVVGLSTTFQNQAELLQRVLDALRLVAVRAVVTTGPIDPDCLDAPPKVLVLRQASHHHLTPDAAVVITHAGHGTVMESLAAGVPLLCLPMGRDQPDVAARVRLRGLGIVLAKRSSSEAIAAAIRTLISTSTYRNRAATIADQMANEQVRDLGVATLEELATFG